MSVLIFTGAGISANAGIPVYRQTGSSWTNKDLEAKSHANRYGNHLDELWDTHWGPLSKQMEQSDPTKAHLAITEFQSKHPAIVATQNVDRLHEKAGNDNVAHLHGSMESKCIRCKQVVDVSWKGRGTPECPNCHKKKTRPNVVLFGEMLNAKMMKGLENFAIREATHIISVGSSLNVFPAAGLVFDALGKKNVVIINKDKTAFDKFATTVYHEDADTALPRVLDEVAEELSV